MRPYFFNESGYIFSFDTKPRQLWDFSMGTNDIYIITIYTDGYSPIITLNLNFDILGELFYKMLSIYAGNIVTFGLQLPMSSPQEQVTMTVVREDSGIRFIFRRKNLMRYMDYVDIIVYLTANDAAELVNALTKEYFEGALSNNEFKE